MAGPQRGSQSLVLKPVVCLFEPSWQFDEQKDSEYVKRIIKRLTERHKACLWAEKQRGVRGMTEEAREAVMAKGILKLLQLRQKMNSHKDALLKSGQKQMDYHQKELVKLDHEYGIVRQRLLYDQPKEQAKALLALLRKKQDEYTHQYGDVFVDLLVQVINYVESHDDPADLAAEELTLE